MMAAGQRAGALELLRMAERHRFGAAALAIRTAELGRRGLGIAELLGRGQRRVAVEARQDVAYRAWTECRSLSLEMVAALIGRTDHSAAAYAILAGARARGIAAARVSDLRSEGADPIDWAGFARSIRAWRAGRALTGTEAAAFAGIGRGEWRKAELGRAVSAVTMLLICRAAGCDPMAFVPLEAGRVTHETAGKHEQE